MWRFLGDETLRFDRTALIDCTIVGTGSGQVVEKFPIQYGAQQEAGACAARRTDETGPQMFAGLSMNAVRYLCVRGKTLFHTVPAIGADLFFRKPDGLDEVVELLVLEGGQSQARGGSARSWRSTFPRGPRRIRSRCASSLPSSSLIAMRAARSRAERGPGEIQELASVHERRAGRAHVHFLRPVIVEPLDRVFQLGAADNGIIAEQDAFPVDQFPDRDQLHARDQVPDRLVLGHEAPGPGGGVFHERDAGTVFSTRWHTRWHGPRRNRECPPPRRSGSNHSAPAPPRTCSAPPRR